MCYIHVQELSYLDGSGRATSKPIVCYALDSPDSSPEDKSAADALLEAPSGSAQGAREGRRASVEAKKSGSAPLLQGRVFTNLDALARLCDLEFEVSVWGSAVCATHQ